MKDKLKDQLNSDEQIIDSGLSGLYGSGGSMNNQMYRNVHSKGIYIPNSGRAKRRFHRRVNEGYCLSKKKKFYQL